MTSDKKTRCWAAEVSPCKGPISEEHYLTYGLFDSPMMTVATGPLARGGAREIPVKRLVTNSLCEGHNKELADLDQAAIDFHNVLRRIAEIHTARHRIRAVRPRHKWHQETFWVDGCRLERWMLKFAFSAAPVFRDLIGAWRPSAEHAALALGVRPITDSLGLYAVVRPGASVSNEQHFNFSFGTQPGRSEPVAFTASIRGGYRLACAWEPALPGATELHFMGEQQPATLFWHPTRYSFDVDNRPAGLQVRFDWSGRWNAGRHPSVAALRARYPAPPR